MTARCVLKPTAGKRELAPPLRPFAAAWRGTVDPFAYRSDVFTRMPQMAAKDYATLAPAAWAKPHLPGKPGRKDRLRTKASDLQRRCA